MTTTVFIHKLVIAWHKLAIAWDGDARSDEELEGEFLRSFPRIPDIEEWHRQCGLTVNPVIQIIETQSLPSSLGLLGGPIVMPPHYTKAEGGYAFDTPDDAILFKLTFGGAA